MLVQRINHGRSCCQESNSRVGRPGPTRIELQRGYRHGIYYSQRFSLKLPRLKSVHEPIVLDRACWSFDPWLLRK